MRLGQMLGSVFCVSALTLMAGCQEGHQAGKNLVPLKAKFHYAIWFEAGRRQVRSQIPLRYLVWSWSAASSEPASNQIASVTRRYLSKRRHVARCSLHCQIGIVEFGRGPA